MAMYCAGTLLGISCSLSSHVFYSADMGWALTLAWVGFMLASFILPAGCSQLGRARQADLARRGIDNSPHRSLTRTLYFPLRCARKSENGTLSDRRFWKCSKKCFKIAKRAFFRALTSLQGELGTGSAEAFRLAARVGRWRAGWAGWRRNFRINHKWNPYLGSSPTTHVFKFNFVISGKHDHCLLPGVGNESVFWLWIFVTFRDTWTVSYDGKFWVPRIRI